MAGLLFTSDDVFLKLLSFSFSTWIILAVSGDGNEQGPEYYKLFP